ncbi:MAG: hypothetical protein K2X87_11070 [Gemmataceae bacterium]|nr:hypothetical protein [Gemmataceae bacterium]
MTTAAHDPNPARSLALARRAGRLLESIDRLTLAAGDVQDALAEERGWVDAVRFFASEGTLTPAGVVDGEAALSETERLVGELSSGPAAGPPDDRGESFEVTAEPAVTLHSRAVANAWYTLSPRADGTVGVRYGAWCQGLGGIDHPWRAYADRASCLRRFVADVRALLTNPVPLGPDQEAARAELLGLVENILSDHRLRSE